MTKRKRSEFGFPKLRLPIPLNQAISNFTKRTLFVWHRWLPLRLYQLSQWLLTPVKMPKKLPRIYWLLVLATAIILLAYLLAPRSLAYNPYQLMRTTIAPVAVEADEFETEEVPRSSGYFVGYCTYGVSLQISVPQDWGNANTWAERAREDGWEVDRTPEIGGVAVDNYGSNGSGHVAVIIDIVGKGIQVREMNYIGWNIMSERWTTDDEWDWFISERK